jgi:hypothetical protein
MSIAVVLLVASVLTLPQSTPPPDCRDLAECRQLALEAQSREDYELFHDLAWRALQKGRQNDPESMLLVARAQSLSGRPHDALVMLNRLADQKVMTDAATSDDFRRVRELPGWAEFEARMAGVTPPEAKKPEPAAAPPPSPPKPSVKAAPETPRVTDKPAAPEKPPVSEKPSATEPAAVRDEPVVGEAGEALRFSAAPFTPAGFAYDAVSGRFIVGDRESRKLSVVGERSHNATNLASAATA